MSKFSIEGPFEVKCTEGRAGGKRISPANVKEFWSEHEEWAERRGCYVFGLKATRGFRPIYVGMATRTFRQEVFHADKLSRHYNEVLIHVKRGKPVIFLVVQDVKRGKPNIAAIKDLEKFLIETAVLRNPEISNIRGIKKVKWEMLGVNSGRGRPSASACEFKKMMGF